MRIALAQINTTVGDIAGNVRKIVDYATRAKDQGARVAVYPELSALVVDAQHKVERRPLQTGPNIGTDIVVNSGLHEGDRVIVEGIQKVRPGIVVNYTVLAAATGG